MNRHQITQRDKVQASTEQIHAIYLTYHFSQADKLPIYHSDIKTTAMKVNNVKVS